MIDSLATKLREPLVPALPGWLVPSSLHPLYFAKLIFYFIGDMCEPKLRAL